MYLGLFNVSVIIPLLKLAISSSVPVLIFFPFNNYYSLSMVSKDKNKELKFLDMFSKAPQTTLGIKKYLKLIP